jgi:DNA-binding Lrp family transcriptional regulator
MFSYTRTGSDSFHQKIDADMKKIVNAVFSIIPQEHVLSIVLGGGYGRGEGGVYIQDGKEKLFNDYDFFIFIHPLSHIKVRVYERQLRSLGHLLSREIGIDVDFSPLQTIQSLAHAPFWMMWYELKNGHRVVWGRENIFRYMPDYKGEEMPVTEGLKLLLNRGTGLLLTREHLEKTLTAENVEFITRNIYKAILAMGDIYLILKHEYHYSYSERLNRFRKYEMDGIVVKYGLLQDYEQAIAYKLQPFTVHFDQAGFLDWYDKIILKYKVLYFFAFSRYLHHNILDLKTYIAALENSPVDKTGLMELSKNWILNLKDQKGRHIKWNWYQRYPRYRLFYAFPFLAFAAHRPIPPEVFSVLGVEPGEGVKALWQRYLSIWHRYN